jgi:hypothetical protein
MAEQDLSANEEKTLITHFRKDQEKMADRDFFNRSRKLVSDIRMLIGP